MVRKHGRLGLVPGAVVLLLLLSAGVALGQSAATAAAAAPVNQGTAPLVFAGETPRSNLLSYGFTATSTFDDNPLNSNPPQYNVASSIAPHFALNVTRARWVATLLYDPQYSYSANVSGYNSVSQVATGTLLYRVNRRLSISLRNSYSHTTNPAQILPSSQSTPVFGVVDQLNQTGYGGYLDLTTEQGGADISYVLSAHSTLGIGGNYSSVQSSTPATANQFSQDVTSWSGHAFYSHQLTRHQTAGLQFRWARIDALGGTNRATTMALQYFHQIQLSRGFSFSLFGGPELTNTIDTVPLAFLLGGIPVLGGTPPVGASIVIRGRQWAGSGGGTLSWSGRQNAASATFVRQVSDGGALGGIARVDTVSGLYRRQLTARSTLTLSGSYTQNESIDTLSQIPVGGYISAQAQYSHMLGPRAQFAIGYARYQNTGTPVGVQQSLTGNHNQVFVSFSYHFERALGR